MKTSGRRIGMGAVMLIFGLIPANLFAGTVWSTGFEGGLPTEAAASGNWRVVTSAPAAHSGTKGLDISGATTLAGDILVFDLSSVGFADLTLNFWAKVRDSLESGDGDSVQLEWSPNGGASWEPLTVFSGLAADDWFPNQFSLPSGAADNPNLNFRLVATLGTSGDRMTFDDFALSGTLVPEPLTIGLLTLGALIVSRRRRFS